MKLTKQQEIKAMKTYNAYWENYLKGDVEEMASLLSGKYTQVGSAETEVFFNKKDAVEFLHDTIDQVAGKLEMRNRSIRLEMQSNFLLFHELCDLYALAEPEWIFYSKFRATTIMEEKKHGWKIIHQHSSFPDARTGEGENIAIDKIAKENRELREAVKRRTVELEQKNRELEIESALEKVRTIAMGMRKPADMLDVCKTISIQLQSLGVKEIRNVQTAIFYEQRGTYMNYEYYAKHDKTIITETVFTNNEIHNEFATKMLKGKGEIFITHIKGSEVKDWIAYQKTTNVFIDKYLETASSLNYYWFSLGPVALGNSTYHPLTEEEIDLFKRFVTVFELAYRRYLDIEQAETQAKEAQIETSLERVRAVAMGMNKSDDLLSICEISFKEFKKLGFDNIRNTLIHIQYDNQKYFMDYDFSDLTGGAITKIEYGSHPVVEDYLKQIRSAKDAFYQGVIKEDQLEEWKDFRRNSGQIDDPRLDKATALYYYFFSIGIGDIGISTLKSIDESQIKILKRFRNVFDLTYRRYNDITHAEAQAREAQIEAALERVRSRTMGMQKSEELLDTGELLYKELFNLGIPNLICGYVLMDEEKKVGWNYGVNPADGTIKPQPTGIPQAGTKILQSITESWKKQEPSLLFELNEEETIEHQSYIAEHSVNFPISTEKLLSISPKRLVIHTFNFKHGYLLIVGGVVLDAKQQEMVIRFTKVFEQTYTRFLDLQKAEAQAREAKIEASLERVRSKAMAMHNSNDLSETVSVFFKELKSLNVLPWRCGVGQINAETKTTFLTTTSNNINGESFEVTGSLQQEGHPVLDGIFEHWKLQKEYFPVLRGDNIRKYYEIIKPQIAYPKYPLDAIQYGHFIFIKEGFVFAWTENKLSEEELSIFRRFASVLSLTYRRYLDLKEAEERNKIIQAENDRKTKELEEARQLQLSLLPRSLPQLPQFDIAVYMKTATEVGGDYYDFNIQENGVLNIGIGDATGHGLQAGTMITLMKGFFTSDVAKFSPQKFLEHCNSMIRDIRLGRILMSFSHLRFENSKLLISSAGMPPVYYHHKKNNRTEEIIIQGLPLGAMASASYKLVEKQLNSGDTILLLTDGLPEQMNSHKVIFDYSRVLKNFDEIAENAPNEIINRLVQKADDWMGGHKQSDDVTFVVIKVK